MEVKRKREFAPKMRIPSTTHTEHRDRDGTARFDSLDPLGRKHNCILCRIGSKMIEEMYLEWQPTRVIVRAWNDKHESESGWRLDSAMMRYHCAALGLDVRKVKSVERGAIALLDKAMDMLDAGTLKITGETLMKAMEFLAKLDGRFSDGPTTNVIIRQNMQGLEEIASISDPALLREKAQELLRRLGTVKVEVAAENQD